VLRENVAKVITTGNLHDIKMLPAIEYMYAKIYPTGGDPPTRRSTRPQDHDWPMTPIQWSGPGGYLAGDLVFASDKAPRDSASDFSMRGGLPELQMARSSFERIPGSSIPLESVPTWYQITHNALFCSEKQCSLNASRICKNFFALVLANPDLQGRGGSKFASVSTRTSAPVGSAALPSYNFPAGYNAQGGPQGNGHITFIRTKSQFLNAGPRVFNVASDGGFTIVAVVRFTGNPGENETFIALGKGAGNDNIYLARDGISAKIKISVYVGSRR
jgi:hypothetical protein